MLKPLNILILLLFVVSVAVSVVLITHTQPMTAQTTTCTLPVETELQLKICSPTSLSVGTNVGVRAASNAPYGIAYMQIYVDNVRLSKTYYANTIDTYIPLTVGKHILTVQTTDNYKQVTRASLHVTAN